MLLQFLTVKVTQNLCIVLGDLLLAEHEAMSNTVMFLQITHNYLSTLCLLSCLPVPSIWTVVSVLTDHKAGESREEEAGDQHGDADDTEEVITYLWFYTDCKTLSAWGSNS